MPKAPNQTSLLASHDRFTEAYDQLNAAQKQAVDTIDGPLLVIAGPGTGKTQLLSARVANILRRTDTPAQNILCLTFTESGAANMRQRLTSFIGQQAYDVTISTYHSFGSDLIGRYPEYFQETRLEQAIDDLSKRQIVQAIVENLNHRDPLKQTQHHLGDLMSTVSEVKRALLSSDDLRAVSAENLAFIAEGSKLLQPIWRDFKIMPRSLAKAAPYFEQSLIALSILIPVGSAILPRLEPLATLCLAELKTALEDATDSATTKPLTAWKNDWLVKDDTNHFVIAGRLENQRISSLADVLDAYQLALAAEGLYDFDDMILRSIEALETHPALRYTLHEKYLYVLLDEFQDTNAAQLKLVQLLTDNPINEGRPNVLAVGDDDQAIYAFQGAQYSNMIEYYESYRDTTVINLTENYRSHHDILLTAEAVAGQIDSRLQSRFEGMSKHLIAANVQLGEAHIERREFQSQVAERAWIAEQIAGLITSGVAPTQIAIIAPKHKFLEPVVPYLNNQRVPVSYEKRENILEALVVRQIITICQLAVAIAAGNHNSANALWPQVLSYDFWQVDTSDIWQLSWSMQSASHDNVNWSQAILSHDVDNLRQAGTVILEIAARLATEDCETILDYIMGTAALTSTQGSNQGTVSSPLRAFYTSKANQQQPDIFYETISHLAVLRAKLRDYQERADSALLVTDFLRYIGMYQAAEQPMINTSPYAQAADSVQLMTVFKAKGLEFEHVFLINCLDNAWGSSSRGNSNKLSLPANLSPIRHAGATDDERLRIFFVAITRAKQGLYLTSASRSFSGKTTSRLKYLDEQQQPDDSWQAMSLPAAWRNVQSDDQAAPNQQLLELDWRSRHVDNLVDISLHGILAERLERYQLSPTDLIKYIDVEYAGPQKFFFDVILRFPSAASPDSQFGSAVHDTLEWYQHQVNQELAAPTLHATLAQFEKLLLKRKLTAQRFIVELERGRYCLTSWLAARGHIFTPSDIAEKNFRSESVFVNEAHMAGRIDRLEIDTKAKTIVVVDYKTGRPHARWQADAKLHKYQLQLYLYKILIENSRSYKGYVVTTGRLEFIEPDENGTIHSLELQFTADETNRIIRLIAVVWQRIKALDFDQTVEYQPTISGIKQFEADLVTEI